MNIIIHENQFIDSIFYIPANLYTIEEDFSFRGSPSLHEHIIFNQDCAVLSFEIDEKVFISSTNVICGKFTSPPKITIKFLDTEKKLTVLRLTTYGMFQLTNLPIASMVNSIANVSAVGLDFLEDSTFHDSLRLLENMMCASETDESFAIVRKIIAYIDANFAELPANAVQTVAKKFGISQSTLQRCFKKYIGLNPSTYLLTLKRKKMIQAVCSNKCDSLTAQQNGYYDQSHFLNDFKRLFGISVKEYFLEIQKLKNRTLEPLPMLHHYQ